MMIDQLSDDEDLARAASQQPSIFDRIKKKSY